MLLKRRLFAAEKSFFSRKKAISIAFLDTGISPVADFTQPENRIIAFLDLVNGKTEPYDDNGHGTHVTGSFLKAFHKFVYIFLGELANTMVLIITRQILFSVAVFIEGCIFLISFCGTFPVQKFYSFPGNADTRLNAAIKGFVRSGIVRF